jgi:hypothetical protein
MGLVIFAAIGSYLLTSIVVVRWVIRYARDNGMSVKRWGWGAALVMYSFVFWDWLPTVAVHQYYCAKDSGFWVYKTLDQWKAENPGVMETLVANKGAPSNYVGDAENYTETYFLNSRFTWVVKKSGPFPLNRWRREQQVVDSKTGEVLARYVDFSTGNGNIGGEPELRFWLHSDYCNGGQTRRYSAEWLVEDISKLTKRMTK